MLKVETSSYWLLLKARYPVTTRSGQTLPGHQTGITTDSGLTPDRPCGADKKIPGMTIAARHRPGPYGSSCIMNEDRIALGFAVCMQQEHQ